MTLHVFAGPSLAGSPVLSLAGVQAHPPIAHGDLYRLRPAPGDRVLIVDGVYQHTAPVRHKEILDLHAQGIEIYGAASLGALRAVEHHGCGMQGMGTVFGWYRDGRLVSDADVALSHGDADIDYRAFTHALVSIIGVTDRLVEDGQLRGDTADRTVDVARKVHFSDRSSAALRAAARSHDVMTPMALVLDRLGEPLSDVKRQDAEAAVTTLLEPNPSVCAPAAVRVPSTSYRREWRMQHTPVTDGGREPTVREVLAFAQLFVDDFPARHTSHVLANLHAEYPEVGVTVETRPGGDTLPDGADLPDWLTALTPTELVDRRIIDRQEATALDDRARAIRVLVRTFRRRSGRLVYEDIPPEVAPDMPWLITQCQKCLALRDEAMTANARFHPADLPAELIDDAFARLWDTDQLEIHVLDRGFRSLEEFREQARDFYVAARAVAGMRARPPVDPHPA